MKVTIKTEHLNDAKIRKYINDNCTRTSCGFYVVNKPLKVWKKTYTEADHNCVVALEIPVGAKIYANLLTAYYIQGVTKSQIDDRKMRASEAVVVKQFRIGEANGYGHFQGIVERKYTGYKEVKHTRSGHDNSFKYKVGKTVKPVNGFNLDDRICAAGVHFFVNLSDALDYN